MDVDMDSDLENVMEVEGEGELLMSLQHKSIAMAMGLVWHR